MSILGRALQLRLWTPEKAGIVYDERARIGAGGVAVTDWTAMQHTTVWACVTLIADAVSMLPLDTYRQSGQVSVPMPNPPVVAQPHPDMTRADWHGRMLWSLLMRGNAYAWWEGIDGLGQPTALLPLHPDEVFCYRSRETGEVEYLLGRGQAPVPASRMMHVRGLTMPGVDSVTGLSPIEFARRAIGLGLAAQDFGSNLFADGALPSGVLSTEQKIDRDTAVAYQDEWEETHGQRRRRIAVLGGGLQFQQIALAPEEAQFLETRKFSRAEIAGFFRCPPHLVGDVDRSTSWGTGIEEQGYQFVTFTLGSWLRRMEEAWSAVLARPRYCRYKTSALLRGRTVERFNAYQMARSAGWLNIDEIRQYEELAPLPEGKGTDYLQPLNYAPIPPQPQAQEAPLEPGAVATTP